jgi:AcrR family transcriptional regulator
MRMRSGKTGRAERLLDTAARLFGRWGYSKTSVDEIASEAGVSKGAVYLEFRDKEELLRAVVRREIERYSADWLERFKNDPGEWSFARMFQHSLAAVESNPFMKALLTRDQRVFGTVLKKDPGFVSGAITMREELCRRMQQSKAMRDDISAPVLAYLLSVIGYGFIAGSEVIPDEHKVGFDEAVRGLALLLDRGLSPARGPNRKAGRALCIELVARMQKTQASRGVRGEESA